MSGGSPIAIWRRLARGPARPYLWAMLPLLVAERPQVDIERPFRLHSEFQPACDQPQAIDELCEGLERGERDQVLRGFPGSGKAGTMAHGIAPARRPGVVRAANQ